LSPSPAIRWAFLIGTAYGNLKPMETLTLTVPKRGTSFWMEVQEVSPIATSLKQYKGPRYDAGKSCDIPVGSVVLKAKNASFKHKPLYVVCVLLPDGTWHEALDCTPPNCGQQLRERIRTWLVMSAESRVIRAVSEISDVLNNEIDTHLDEDELHTLDDSFVYLRLTQIDAMATMAVASTGNKLVNDELIFDEFQRWLEAVAARTELSPETIHSMLVRGAQRSKTPHVNYLKKFNRAIRFQDNINE
jgi:hypothetical protein